MPDYALAADALRRMATHMLPGTLVLAAALSLAGWRAGATGLLAGAAFALYKFYLLARAATRIACQTNPGRARRMAARSYAARYALTALFLLAVIRTGFASLLMAILPLFAPGFILITYHIGRKGGE